MIANSTLLKDKLKTVSIQMCGLFTVGIFIMQTISFNYNIDSFYKLYYMNKPIIQKHLDMGASGFMQPYEIKTKIVPIDSILIRCDNIILTDTLEFARYINGDVVVFSYNISFAYIFFFTLLLAMIVLFAKMFIMHRFFDKLDKNNMSDLKATETIMSNKSLMLLAENLHHELKTPLVVINDIINDIKDHYTMLVNEVRKHKEKIPKRVIDRMILVCHDLGDDDLIFEACATNKTITDIEIVQTQLNSIYNVLERMNEYKKHKVSIADKDMYYTINIAFATLDLFRKNKFEYEIDTRLRGLIVKGINNEDLMHIMINHTKNSLRANASRIEVHLIKHIGDIAYIQFMDDGDGVPPEIEDTIFELDVTSKNKDEMPTTGIGLYLSKTTLALGGGDEYIINTSNKGTSFGFEIPSIRQSVA